MVISHLVSQGDNGRDIGLRELDGFCWQLAKDESCLNSNLHLLVVMSWSPCGESWGGDSFIG